MKILDEKIIQIYKETSNTLTGSNRRAFQAKIAKEYLGGNPTRTESVFGWGRSTVVLRRDPTGSDPSVPVSCSVSPSRW